jgi:hypothetical protein
LGIIPFTVSGPQTLEVVKSTTVLEWGIAEALDLLAMAVLLSPMAKTSDESATNPSNQSRQAVL